MLSVIVLPYRFETAWGMIADHPKTAMVSIGPQILTVSELTQEIKEILEVRFTDLWVEGEISNLRTPGSGHTYLTLKDEFSQIRAVLFRNQARRLRFVPQDGLQVICRARVSVYEPRGEYQLILETLEPKGIGALQLAFLQLKERLEKEGFFDLSHKKPLPLVPERIGIVTSPTGAVIRDMLNILERRFENLHILLYPVRVQGEGASVEIAEGIDYFNKRGDVDVIIVGRGGGSLEDLWPFNEEQVARAIYRSKLPVISAVGHETDITISDFVADLRAPTPSTAAELVVQDKRDLEKTLSQLRSRLQTHILQALEGWRTEVHSLRKSLGDPVKAIQDLALRLDDFQSRLLTLMFRILQRGRETALYQNRRLVLQSPLIQVARMRLNVYQTERQLAHTLSYGFAMRRERMNALLGKIHTLSPLAILQRGYSITRKLPSLELVKKAVQLKEGEKVDVKLSEGGLVCEVKKVETP